MNGGAKKDGSLDISYQVGLTMSTFSGAFEAYGDRLNNDILPYTKDLPKIALTKLLSQVGKMLGIGALAIDAASAIADYLDGDSPNIYALIGKISVALFAYGAGSVITTAAAGFFFPIWAAIIASAVITTLTIVLLDFTVTYFSYRIRGRFGVVSAC
jgi:hypothetical protein